MKKNLFTLLSALAIVSLALAPAQPPRLLRLRRCRQKHSALV